METLAGHRDPVLARRLTAAATRPWRIMEVRGGPTRHLVGQGIDTLLPAGIRMVHGPGCPVSVTPLATSDRALAKDFRVADRAWRGIGVLQCSGLGLAPRSARSPAACGTGVRRTLPG